MVQAAAEAVSGRAKLIAVTILTSLSDADLEASGFASDLDTAGHARELAKLAKANGADGVVCSPHDLAGIKHDCGVDFLTVVPGIRPASAEAQDQKRIATPATAVQAGADILVIGRPITQAADPAATARDILAELGRN